MYRRIFCKVVAGAAVAVAMLALSLNEAQATWFGSKGGGWGSTGGGWGGGGLFGKKGRRHVSFHSTGGGFGSTGGWGSTGGSTGGWGSTGGGFGSTGGGFASTGGGFGSTGGWGSSGGFASGGSWGSTGGSWATTGGTWSAPAPAYYAPPATAPLGPPADAPPPGQLPPAPGQEASLRAQDALLSVTVPENAKVYVNGVATNSTGSQRRYVSRGLDRGYNYSYEVRAELQRDGRTIEQTKTVQMRAGETADLAFNLQEPQSLTTTLTLDVPAEAKVYLAGAETSADGPVRVFSTERLAGGQEWADYEVRVTLERDGRMLSQERTISLKAGDSRQLRFDFENQQVADAR